MKASTGRDTKAKHSTGNDQTMTKKSQGSCARPRTSTGENAAIAHVTGRLFDLKRKEDAKQAKRTKRKGPQAA